MLSCALGLPQITEMEAGEETAFACRLGELMMRFFFLARFFLKSRKVQWTVFTGDQGLSGKAPQQQKCSRKVPRGGRKTNETISGFANGATFA